MGDDQEKDEMESQEAPMDMGEEAGAAESPAEEVKDAFKAVGKGLGKLFSSIGAAVRDPEMQERAKAKGASVVDAVGSGINTVAGQVRETIQRRGDSDDEVEAETDTVVEGAARELDDADAVEEIRADLEGAEEE